MVLSTRPLSQCSPSARLIFDRPARTSSSQVCSVWALISFNNQPLTPSVKNTVACRARIKRRRVDADSSHALQYHNPTRVQALPLPSRSPNAATSTATTKSDRTFHSTNGGCREPKEHQSSEVEAERIGERREGSVVAGTTSAETLQTRRHRGGHRRFLSNEALVGKLAGSIPKLVLLPQTARVCSVS